MQKNISSFPGRGFSIIEIVLGIGMITMFIVSNSYYYKKMLDVSQETTRSIQSGFLLEEGVEAIKLMRDESWDNNIDPLTPGVAYYFYWDGLTWTPTTTPQIIETVFTRSFTVAEVYRNASDDISVDPVFPIDYGTKKVIISVAWMSKGNRTTTIKSIETYVMKFYNN